MALLKLKKSSVAGKVPLTTDLAYGELALNYADGKLFFKSSTDAILSFNTGGSSTAVVPISLTAPSAPESGNLWWDSTAGKLKIYYDDTTSAQWVDAGIGSGGSIVTYGISSETTTGGTLLRLSGSDATTDDITLANGSNVSVTRTDANTITISATDTNTTYGISSETTTGGALLRLSGSDTTTDDVKLANGSNITITRTDANTLTIAATDTNTTYGISSETTTGGALLRLTGSDAATDDVKLANGSNITITRTDANTLTIASSSDMSKSVYDTNNNGKVDNADSADVALSVAWTNVSGKPSTFPPSTHTHVSSDITDLGTTIGGYITTHQAASDPHSQYTTLVEIADATGDVHGIIDRTASQFSFVDATRTFTVTPVSGSWTFYYHGTLYTVSSPKSIVLANTSGARFIKIDPATLNLVEGGPVPDFAADAIIAYIYYNATTGEGVIIGDERHGYKRDTTWHSNQHLNVGTVWRSGGTVTYTTGNAASVQLGIGTPLLIADEDLLHTITHSATPTTDYQQILNTAASLEVLYLSGTSYTSTAASTTPWIAGTSLARYNLVSGGSGSLVDATEGSYITYWLLATNDIRSPVKLVLGRQAHATIDAAYAETFEEYGLSFAEQVFMQQIVVQTSSAYTANAAKIVIAAVRKVLSKVATSASTISATEHNSLTGRDVPDVHTISSITGLTTALSGKQETLVSGTNIKTINGTSVLGSGDITITGGSGTVTSVSGTGTVSGLTLTGTVTTSGSLTLGGTLDLSSPPEIGGTAPAAATFTTIASSTAPTNTVAALALTGTPNNAVGGKVGVLQVGPAFSAADKNILSSFVQNINDYTQIIVQNQNAGAAASADFVVNNDNSTGSGIYGDFGINSTGFTGTGSFNLPSAVYLYANSSELVIGTRGANGIRFVTNNSTTDAGGFSSAGVFSTTNANLTTPAISGATYSTSNNFVAGTNTQGSGPITTDNVVVTSTANNPSGITLPTALTGRMITVMNRGTNPVNIYPASGGQIDALGANAALSLPVGEWIEFNAASGTQWYSTINAIINTSALNGSVALANGGTGGTDIQSATNNLIGYTSTPTAGGTTTFTAASTIRQIFTGTAAQTIVLPVASTMVVGYKYEIINNSTGVLTVNSSGGNLVMTISPGAGAKIRCILNSGTTAASWDWGWVDLSVDTRLVPQNSQTGSYTVTTADIGKHIYHPAAAAAATYTIPANSATPFEIGTTLTFVNMSTNAVTIAITTDTMYLAGTGTTGSRTLALYGVATALKMTATTWIISGSGLT